MIKQGGNNVAQSFQQQNNGQQQFQNMLSNNNYQSQPQQYSSYSGYGQYNNYGSYSNNNPYSYLSPAYQQVLQNNMSNYNSSLNQQNNTSTSSNNQSYQSIVWVQGEAGAKAYPVSPGYTVMLMDSEDNVFYIKTTDTNGIPLPLKVFDYSERKNNEVADGVVMNKNSVNINNNDKLEEQFVTRDEYKKLIDEINNLREQWGKKYESNIQHVEQQQNTKSTKQQHNKYNSTV